MNEREFMFWLQGALDARAAADERAVAEGGADPLLGAIREKLAAVRGGSDTLVRYVVVPQGTAGAWLRER